MTDDDTDEFEPSEHDDEGDDGPDPSDPFADTDGAADDPFADPEGGEDVEGDPFTDVEGVEAADDPFTHLSVGDEDPSTDFGPSDNTLFTDEGGSDLDEEAVWEEIEAGSDGAETSPELDEEPIQEAPATDDARVDDTETVVKKRSYCERCEHFSQPPEVSCTYPNSEIVELIDTRRFRVRNCPIVERRQSSDISSIAEGGGTTDPELEGGSTTDPELEAGDAADPGGDD